MYIVSKVYADVMYPRYMSMSCIQGMWMYRYMWLYMYIFICSKGGSPTVYGNVVYVYV